MHIFKICWYAPAEQPPPTLAEANKILAKDESVKWSSRPTDPIQQRLKKKFKKPAATSGGGPGPFQGPSSSPQLFWWSLISNHVHLLLADDGDRMSIPRSIKLVAGRSGQEYSQRKNRKGAFWEDRYHAMAVETERHFLQCLVYIELNMVRAGVVVHPIE